MATFDTIQLRHQHLMPSPRELDDRGFSRAQGQPGKWRWDYSIAGKTLPRLTWRSTESGDWLTAEVSLPKMLYSSNVLPITDDDVRVGMKMISQFVADTAGVAFEASRALVGRVDCSHSFPVGEAYVMPYLNAVSRATFPQLPRRITELSSVTFKNNSKEVQLYDKWEEMAVQVKKGEATEAQRDIALGILRIEVRYRTSPACARLATKHKLPDRTAKYLLSSDIAYREIEEALNALGLDHPIGSIDTRVDRIIDAYGDTPLSRRLLGFITLLDRYGEGFWKHGYAGYKRSKYLEEAKLLRNAGIWLHSEQPLPTLVMESPTLANAA